MKVFWGVNVTHQKENDQMDGEELITAQVSAQQAEALAKNLESLENLDQQSKLPTALRVIRSVCGVAALLCIAGIIKGTANVTLAQAYANAPWVFYIVAVGIPVWAVLAFMGRVKEKSVAKSPDTVQSLDRSQAVQNDSYAMLGVPASAVSMDVLLCRYRIKSGKIVFKSFDGFSLFFNANVKAFVEGGMLCLADLERRYSIPIAALTGVRTIRKRVSIPSWNKATPYNSNEWKAYKITANQFGQLFLPSYEALCFHTNGEDYELYFPSYELPVLEGILGCKAEPVKLKSSCV